MAEAVSWLYGVKNERTREVKSVRAVDKDDAINKSGFDPIDVRWAWACPGSKQTIEDCGVVPRVEGKNKIKDKGENKMTTKKNAKANVKKVAEASRVAKVEKKKVAKKKVEKKSSDRRAAALKAWETIRANKKAAEAAKSTPKAKAPKEKKAPAVASVNKPKRPRNKKKTK